MATILESIKKIEPVTEVSQNVVFFQVMREKLEYQKLQAMKEVADAKYKVKSFSRQVREIEKTIQKIKEGKPIKLIMPAPKKILKPIEVAKEAPILFTHPSVIQNKTPKELDPEAYFPARVALKCEKCNNLSFPSKKLLKEHQFNIHSY